MDYKKKYEEAMLRMNKWVEGSEIIDPKEVAEFVFPELKKSEDDRVRKELISLVKNYGPQNANPELYKDMLAWLEKQGEKIDAIENLDTEFEKQVSHLIASAINKEHEYNQSYVKWTANALLNYAKHELEKQGEQSKQHLYDIIIALWDLLDKIDTFSDLQIDDTNPDNPFKKIEYIAQERHKFVKSDGYNLYIQGEQITDFKQSKQKTTWSEEDERIRYAICDTLDRIDEHIMEYNNQLTHQQVKDWLKSLKERYIWKPGDEQINVLVKIINSNTLDTYTLGILQHLYQDLIKMKEE